MDLVWHGTRLVMAGPATGRCARTSAVGAPVFGVRFRLGVAGTALGLPAEELADANVPVAEVWGPDVDERVAAGGLPALLDLVRERVRDVEARSAGARRGARRWRRRARAWTSSERSWA